MADLDKQFMDEIKSEAIRRDNSIIPARLALRPKDAAKALGIGQRKLWELTKVGAIPCVRVGVCVLYPIPLLQEWLSEQARLNERKAMP